MKKLIKLISLIIFAFASNAIGQVASLESELENLAKNYNVRKSTFIAIKCYSASYMLGAYANDNSNTLKKIMVGDKLIETSIVFAQYMIKNQSAVAANEDELLKLAQESLTYYDSISKSVSRDGLNLLDSILWKDYYLCQRNKGGILK